MARCAKRFGDSQLAQCANQVSSDQMPSGAAQHGYSEGLRAIAKAGFEGTDIGSVLWLNGLLGYVDDTGREAFYSLGGVEAFALPERTGSYVVHPCLAHSVGLDTRVSRATLER